MEWFANIENLVREQLSGSREKDQRFFRVEEFLRMTKRTGEFSSTCRDCDSFKYEIEKKAGTIGEAVEHTGKARKEYDRLLGRLSSHMRKQHGFYPPYYFTYLYGASVTAIVTTVAILLSFLFSQTDKWFFIVPAFVFGLLVGNLLGAKKDSGVRKDQKLL